MKIHESNVSVVALMLSIAAVVWGAMVSAADQPDEAFKSRRLSDLAKQLKGGDTAANQKTVDSFWQKMQGRGPMIDTIADDAHSAWVTFLWRGDSQTKNVAVLGGPPTSEYGAKLVRLNDTDLWYRTDRIPNDARLVYRFIVNVPDNIAEDPKAEAKFWEQHPPRPDPLNPAFVTGNGSLLEMPAAPPQPWLKRVPGVSSLISDLLDKAIPVRQVQESKLQSALLKQERTFGLYLPPSYDPTGKPCGLLVMFDGNGCNQIRDSSFPVPVILDNLITDKKIPPLVTLFVFQSTDRNKELACSEAFADFVAKELVPKVRSDYNVSSDPAHTIVSGLSLGGLMSAYCGYRHPDVFGNVLSLSGSYQWCPGMFEGTMARDAEPGWLTRQLATSRQLPIRFYLAAGRFENFFPFSLLGENRRLRDVLCAKGNSIQYSEFNGGHDPVCWRGPFVEGLVWLTGTPQQKK